MTGPTYRLCLAEAVSGKIVADLPQPQGVPSWGRQLNASGSLTSVQVPLTSAWDASMIQRLNEPWRWVVIYAYGNAILQAGFLINAVVDDTQTPAVVQMSSTTLWDFFSKKRLVFDNYGYITSGSMTDVRSDLVFSATSPDPANQNLSWGSVARRVVELSTIGNPDLRFSLPIVLPAVTAGTATITYAGADGAYVGQRLTELTQQSGGSEIEFSPEWTDDSHAFFRWRMRIGTPRLGQLGYPFAWDYQKACSALPVTIDGTDMTWRVNARGQDNRGTAGGTLVWTDSSAVDPAVANVNWPWLQTSDNTHGSETSVAVVQSYAQQTVLTNDTPITTAAMIIRNDGLSITAQATGSPSIDMVSVGDTGVVGVKRHPVLADGQYALRVLAMASGRDQWTTALSVHLLGLVTS